MNQPSKQPTDEHDETWDAYVKSLVARFEFPPTPDIADVVRARIAPNDARRRVMLTQLAKPIAVLLVVALVITLLVPDLRARAFGWLKIGAIWITDDAPSTTHTPVPSGLEFDVTPIWSILDWDYKITRAEAQARVDFPLPVVPDLGEPDAVFFYELDEPVVILVWKQLDQLPISLHLIGSENRVFKYSAEEQHPVTVNGRNGLWLVSPHLFEIMPRDGGIMQRFVNGSVLIWEFDGVTYRLEGDLTLDEALRLAESLD